MQKKNHKLIKTTIISAITIMLLLLLILSDNIIKLQNGNKLNIAESTDNTETLVQANAPKLSAGMIPVKWNGENWIITSKDATDWYDYSQGKPAYIMLNDGTYQSEIQANMTNKKLASENVGVGILDDPQNTMGSIYMWIPRFEQNDETGKIKYIQNVGKAEDGYTIPDMFAYKQEETKPDFLLTGVWIAVDTDANYTTTITNMTGEDNTYGFIANTKAMQITNEDINALHPTKAKYYGKAVTNYTAGGVDNWRVFHIDENDNIYLIADDYVENAKLPMSTGNAHSLNIDGAYKAYFTNVLSDYTGSAWIRGNTNSEALKWLSYVNDDNYPNSENENIKAVAYMMDTKQWSEKFANNEYAEYAIGGPTLELYCASYKVTHSTKYIECDSVTSNGYQVKWNTDSSYAYNIGGVGTDFNSIYKINSSSTAFAYWLASPSARDANRVMAVPCVGGVDYYNYNNDLIAFRPLVCLKSSVKLVSNGDDTYSINLVQNADNTGFNITDLTMGINDITNTNRVILKIINSKDIAPKLTFDVNGGTTTVENITVKYGDTIILPAPERKYTVKYVTNNSQELEDTIVAYTFDGWYTAVTGGEKREYTTMPAHNETLYAHWTATSITLPKLTADSDIYEFEGWYSDSGFTTSVGVGETTYIPTNNITLYGKWKTPIGYYGKLVTNYSAGGVSSWRIFHMDDENIYLIADSYVPNANLPKSTGNAHSLNTNGEYKAYFTDVLNDYTGSAWIRSNTNTNALKWLTWVNTYPSSTNENIKAVAYMMDTKQWSEKFANNEYAEYAIGGPTLELYCASYKVTHPTKYIECDYVDSTGYKVKWNTDSSHSTYVRGLATSNDFNNIYIIGSNSTAWGYWLASPCAYSTNHVVVADYYSYVGHCSYNHNEYAFRPLVCLKSGVKLVSNGDGTYKLQTS